MSLLLDNVQFCIYILMLKPPSKYTKKEKYDICKKINTYNY